MTAFAQILSRAIEDYRAAPSERAREEVYRARLAAELNDAIARQRTTPNDAGARRLRAARDALRECLRPKAQSRPNQGRQTTIRYSQPRTLPTMSFSIGPLERVLRAMSDDPESLLFAEPIKPQS